MATYSATDYDKVPVPSHGLANNCKALFFEVACSAAPATTDTINFGYVPAGARVVMAVLESTDMDTNGAPTLTIDVGDASDTNRIFAASTVGQAGTLSTAIATAGAGYSYTDKTLITGVAAANAATGAAGTLYLTLFYVVEGSAS
ncbi:hypothetical protein [Novosphingobium mathurense]|uniref:Uncharacterized protein n=1 Tax=Novosphingobium mathurense TaxID=428990 RepID=A0A1U6I6Y8_9SPHN|nr:hypothetical protein [Novosphingobium mathurense]SLK03749.1 hypothetical protein SAMN06295987_104292 [Novosphingobium mathurense]